MFWKINTRMLWSAQPSLANSVCWGYRPRYSVINHYFCSEYSKIGWTLGENWSKLKIERFNPEKVKKTGIFHYLAIFGNMPSKAQKSQKLGIFTNISDFDEINQKKLDEPIAVLDLKFDLFDNYSVVKLFGKVKYVIIIHIRHMRRHSTSLFSRTVETVIFELSGVINMIGPTFADFGLIHCENLHMIQRSVEYRASASWG